MKRLQFDFDDQSYERLNRICKITGSKTKAEAVRRALKLLDVAAEAEAAGGCVIIKSKDGVDQRILFI